MPSEVVQKSTDSLTELPSNEMENLADTKQRKINAQPEMTMPIVEKEVDKLKKEADELNHHNQHNRKPFRIDDDPPHLTDEDGWLDILGSGELKKRVVKNGKGANSRPERGNWVTLNVTSRLPDGSIVEEIFNMRTILGDNDLVQGLEIALTLMELEETAELLVPARLAYGELGRLPEIPPESTMHYEVELIAIEEAVDEKELPFAERKLIGDAKREKGNFWYGRGDYSTAIHCYRRALDFLDYEDKNLEEPPAELQELLEMRLKVHNNLAASQLKIEAFEAAMKSVDFVLQVHPNNVKALFRKGKILAAKGENSEAIEVLKKALKLEPETKIIHQELSRLQNKKRQDEKVEKAMYRKMFGQTKQPHPRSSSLKVRFWFHKFGLLLGSLVIVAVSIAVYKQVHSNH